MTDTNSRQRVADIVSKTLFDHGVRHAFGMPGGEVVTMLDAFEKAGIQFHLSRHETAAAIMASGAITLTAKPQVLLTTVGPGLANAVNGIADASQERVPLIVISGIVDRETRGRYTHQVIDHGQLLRPLVKGSFEIERESASSTIARAIALATAEPMGPVHLDLAPSVAAQEYRSKRTIAAPQIYKSSVSLTDPAVRALAEKIYSAERPLIIAGLGAVRCQAGVPLEHLAETICAPVITTYKAKGLLSERHPLAMGAAGLSPLADQVLLELARKSDLVLLLGYDPIEMRLGWLDFSKNQSKIVEIGRTSIDHGMHHAGIRIDADEKGVLQALAGSVLAQRGWPEGEPEEAKQALTRIFATKSEWGPHAIVDQLNNWVQASDIVTVDSGAHRILLSQKWIAQEPLTLLQSAGFCTMNAALPLAIGAKISDPSRRVFAVMGDGGLEMGLGELATIRDHGLPVTIIVFQDRSLTLIALKQSSAGLRSAGVTLGETDFAAVARAFGGFGINVETADGLRSALERTDGRNAFTLIACRFDTAAYAGAF